MFALKQKILRFAEPTLRGLYRDNGKEYGKHYIIYVGVIYGFSRDSGKWKLLYDRDNGKENGNYYRI